MLMQNSLSRLRAKTEYNQAEVAKALGMAQGDYSRAENGRYLLSWEQVEKAAEMFGCSPDAVYSDRVKAYLFDKPAKPIQKRQYKNIRLPLLLAKRAEEAAAKHGYNGAADFVAQATREKLEGLSE